MIRSAIRAHVRDYHDSDETSGCDVGVLGFLNTRYRGIDL
jgi:hypothetical protein